MLYDIGWFFTQFLVSTFSKGGFSKVDRLKRLKILRSSTIQKQNGKKSSGLFLLVIVLLR